MSSDAETPPGLADFHCDCGDYESVISPTAYLADLVDYAAADEDGYGGHLYAGDDAVTIPELDATFYQPFERLAADTGPARETARHVRIAVESLLGFLADDGDVGTDADPPAASATAEYRLAAYEALLDALDCSREDLRDAAYDESDREWVADAVGVPEDRVTDLRLDPDAPLGTDYDPLGPDDATYPVSEANLEALFGLPRLIEDGETGRTPADPLRTIEEPFLRVWRREYLREEWSATDHPEDPFPRWIREDSPYDATIGATPERPTVDPDLIGPDDLRPKPTAVSEEGSGATLPDPGVPEPTEEFDPPSDYVGRTGAFPERPAALALWEVRREWMDEQLEALWRDTPAGPGSTSDVAAMLNGMLDPPSYRSRTGETVWYAGHAGRPTDVPSATGAGAPGADPLAGKGFLEDFARLHTQLTGEAEPAREARAAGAASQYPTGDADDDPASAARTVVEEELHLDQRAFVRLVGLLRTHYGDGEQLDDEAWWEVASILAGARKRSCADAWIAEESDFEAEIDGEPVSGLAVQLDRTHFWQAPREPGEGEWSFRLDRHDPADPDADPEPYVDPERTSRSELADAPHGEAARALYDQRRETLADRREELAATLRRERRSMQADFESFASTYRSELQSLRSQLPDSGQVPDSLAAQSPIDPALDTHYGSVSWPDPSWTWERRFEWLSEGLRLAREPDRSSSSLSSAERQHAGDAEAKLEALGLTEPAFEQLATLREQAKPLPPEEQGLTDDQLGTAFATLPTGNPLGPVLTSVFDSLSGATELQDVFDDRPPRWDPLFASIRRSLEEQTSDGSGSSGASSGGQQRPPALEILTLTAEEFETVLSLRRQSLPAVEPEAPSEALVDEVIALLTSVWKRLEKYDASGGSGWIAEEEQAGVEDYWDAYRARLPPWRGSTEERSAWQEALFGRSTAPIVDPDLLEGVSDFEPPAHDGDGFALWEDRRDELEGEHGTGLVYEVEQLRLAAERDQSVPSDLASTKLDASIRRTVGLDLETLRSIARRMERGDEVGAQIARVDLTPAGLTHLLEVDDALGSRPVRVEEWASVAQILLRAWKHRQYGRWNREERARGVLLEPDQFSLPPEDADRSPPADDDPRSWRVEWSVRTQWTDTLETRIDQWEGVDDEIDEAVAAAEREALSILREQLLDRIDEPSASASDAEIREWVSERLLIDVEMTPDRDTTRTSQAITSLQNLVESIDLSLDDDSGLDALDLSIDDAHFDQRWRWLGTYAKWKAAMGVYVYPQNVLLPTLRRRTTERFDDVASDLSQTADLTPAAASAAAQEYADYVRDVSTLQPEAGAMAPGPTVAQRGEDDPAALAYVFAESDESGNAYFLAFDPESQYQPATPDDDPEWPDNSTWNRIPVEAVQSARGIHAAATYRDSIYLFVTTTKDAGSESDGGQGGGTGSEDGEGSGSGDILGYVTYDPRADRWSELTEIEFPETAPLDGAAVEVSWREHYHSISPVLRAGWNEPPELYVTRSGEGDFGLEPFGFFVALEDDGTAPDTEAIREDSVGTLPGRYGPKRIVAYDSSHRTLFYTRAAHVVDRRSGTVVTDVDYADLADDSVGYAFDVFVRPTSDDAFVVGYDDGGGAVTQVRVSGTGLTHGQTDAVTHALGGTARHGRSLVHCNNAVTRPLERISHSNEVVVTAASPGDDPEHVLQVDPAVVGRSKSIGERRALAPAVPDASQDDHPWRLAIDPGEAGESREETTRRQRDRIDDVRANTARTQQVYLEEANYFLPLLIARQLTRAGEYESALDWYRCIYDHTRDTPEERAIWPPLAPDSGEPDAPSSPLSRWLLDPIDPHGLAAARASGPDEWGQAYTQFTLFSLARCLSDYGDAQFATDTAETVAMATDLYEQALDVLELGPLSPGIDHCGDLIERLESALETHVFDLEVWTEQPGLTRAGAESRADRIVTVAREIDRYVDREEAVAEITDAVAEEGLTAALGVANEWADRERAEREYRDRRSEASQVLREFVRRRPDLEPRLVETATAVAELQRAPVAVAGGGGDGSSIGGGGAGGSGSGGGAGGSGGSGSGGSSGGPDPSGEATAASTAGLSTPAWLDDEVAASVSPANLDAAGVVEPVGSAEVEYEHDDYAGPVTVVDEEDVVVDVDVDFEETDDDAVSDVAVDRGTLDVLEANRHRFCIPDNPLLDSLRRHAEVNLEKIREGRNIAGMKRELDPYASDVSIESAAPTPGGVAGAGVEFQPTDYRYETLLSRAKDLAEQARQFESQYRTAIEQGVSERRKLKRARQKVDLAEERVSLQEVRMERARSKVELARLKRERAVLKRDRYKQWIENPLVSKERAAIDKLQQAVTLQRTAADLQIGATVAHGVAAGLHVAAAAVYGTGGKAGQAVSSSAAASSSIAAGLSSAASVLTTDASKLSTQAQIRQIEARKQRRKRRWKLKRDLAKQNVEIGDQRISIARKTVDVVEAERAVAQLRADHAEDIVNFHEEKFTNRELYDWIAGVLKGVYRYFLQQSASIARMAQRQLAFERQSLPREFVGSDYWDAPTTGQTAVPAAGETGGGSGSGGDETGRRGLTGSARLLQDIYELDQHEFRTEQRRLEVEKTISVAQQDPMALQRFRESGVLSIATELADFDADHPGHYHRMIESVDVTIVALTPPTAGVNATLRNSGTSEIVVGDTIYQERTIDRDPEEIVLNRARGREAGNEIRFRQDDSERLRPFEHSGVATDWELRMPKAANDMDYGTVADVQLTIGYTALDSYDRRQQVLSELDAERGAERAYSFHDDFSDAWYGLLNAPADASSTTVAFETSRDDFPANLQGFTLDTAQLYAVVSGPDRAAQREDLKDLKVTVEPAGGSATKGRATNGTVDLGSLEADDPDQRWELTVTPTGTGDPFADGTIEDLLFLVGGEGTVPSWPA